jgi:ectoine hydroxylase-related dioxygenase (phytanoyl-CoA dioxygenase family)
MENETAISLSARGSATSATPVPECFIRETGLRVKDILDFQRVGVLALRNVIDADELSAIQHSGGDLIDWAWQTGLHEDVVWTAEPGGPDAVPTRIEYPVDKSPAIQMLAGHPLLLATAEALVGPNLIPTWDSLVFKTDTWAPRLAWHRDDETYQAPAAVVGSGRVIDMGIYLDPAPEANCVWCIPGSNYWSSERAGRTMDRLNASEWDTDGAVPALMRPGDVLIHNILTLHAAPAVRRASRRVIYFEYRPAELEWDLGPHNREYVGLKQRVLLSCIALRAAHFDDERPFEYRPAEAMRHWDNGGELTTYRYPHKRYWTGPTYGGQS